MFKLIPILLFALCANLTAGAQFRYTFKDTTTPYVPLTGATSLNGSLIWDEEILSAPMPFTWKIDNTLSVNRFNLALEIPGVAADTTNFGSISGFVFGDMDITDRGMLDSISTLSPIRYLTSGTAPNRIFKLEIANAGFFDEFGLYNTMDDSISVQIWVYETKNIVEFHYGPSKISHANDYFGVNSAGPFTGYFRNVNVVSGTTGTAYFLKGNAASPALDTLVLPTPPSVALNSWPANGKVYRFTPKATSGVGVGNVAAFADVKIYPSPAQDNLTIEGLQAGDVAIIHFMIGQKVLTSTIKSGKEVISLSGLPASSYLLTITGKTGETATMQFVKQ
jgi:hypothetical protein